MFELAKAIDRAAKKYDVRVILTPQHTDISRIACETQHMDPIKVGRGLGAVLPEAVKAAGARGVMLNHAERPVSIADLNKTIKRAKECDLYTVACADSISDATAIAYLNPDIIVCVPSELIGTGKTSDELYVSESIQAVKSVNPDILVLQGAGISNGEDVYRVIKAGAEATGTTRRTLDWSIFSRIYVR